MRGSSVKLVLVQALRAFAALLVVMHHAQFETAALAIRANLAFEPSTLLPWPVGVDVFFVISGFIIVYASAALYRRPGGRRRFLAHRVARLVPLYWLVSTAFLAIALTVPSVLNGDGGASGLDPVYVAASFLFWPMVRSDGTALPLYGLGWTLNCEMFFYALFAIGIGWGRRAAVAWLVAALALLALARAADPDMPMPLAFWTNPVILEFAFGAGLGLARAEGLRIGGPLRAVLLVAGLGLLMHAPEPSLALHPFVYGLPSAMLVAAAALGHDAVSRADDAPILAVRAAAALGDSSYALYLVHPFVLRGTREAIARTGLAPLLGPWGSLAVMIGFAVLVSFVVYRVIERPLTRAARRLLDPAPGAEKALEGAGPHVPPHAKRT
jgi:peptidoglycan/LPS O-acetylase OafA/YrhL